MSVPSLAQTDARPDAASAAATATGTHPALLAVGSALLLWTTFPPADWGWLVWIALVPFFLLIPSRRSKASLYFGAWVGGMAFWTLAVQWVRLSDSTAWVAWLAMAFALSLFWPLFLALSRLAVHRLRLPMMIAAPVIWVALEYVRAYVVTGFPWYYLAHSQHSALAVIQIADIAGSLGVSLVIAVVNAWVVDVLTLPLLTTSPLGPKLTPRQTVRLFTVIAMVGGTVAYGAFRLATAHFRDGPRVALLQSSLIQRYKESSNAATLLAIYRRLIERVLEKPERADLIVWPETSYPYQFSLIDPAVDDTVLGEQLARIGPKLTVDFWRSRTELVAAQLHGWADTMGVPMLVGALTYDHRPAGLSKFNSALLFEPKVATLQSYHKLHLVPFGEYVPLITMFPWLTVFTPYHGASAHVPSLDFGREPTVFDLGPYRIATAICFEDTVPQVVQRFFTETPDGRQPDALLNLSNDGWFHGSSEHEMHLAISIFRAVEHRVPLARAANTGVSAIVDGNGRVREMLATLKEGVVSGILPLDDRSSYYSAWGDWLGRSCLAVTIGLVPLGLMRRRERRPRVAT